MVGDVSTGQRLAAVRVESPHGGGSHLLCEQSVSRFIRTRTFLGRPRQPPSDDAARFSASSPGGPQVVESFFFRRNLKNIELVAGPSVQVRAR